MISTLVGLSLLRMLVWLPLPRTPLKISVSVTWLGLSCLQVWIVSVICGICRWRGDIPEHDRRDLGCPGSSNPRHAHLWLVPAGPSEGGAPRRQDLNISLPSILSPDLDTLTSGVQARQRCTCIKTPLPRLSLLSSLKASEVSISYHVQNDQGLNTAIPTADSVYQINL